MTRSQGKVPVETTKTPLSGTKSGTPALAARTAVRARNLWERPAVAVARALLWDYVSGGWVVGGAAALVAYFFLAFRDAGDSAHFFEAASAGLGALAIAGTVVAMARVLRPGLYAPLAERYGRGAYGRGMALALVAVRLGSYLYVLALALLSGKLIGATFGVLLAGSLGLLANVIVLSLATVALYPPFATQRWRMGLLAWLVIALFSYTDNGFLAWICVVARLPLLPLAACFDSGITGELGWGGLLGLLIVTGYALGLVRLIAWRLEARPLEPAAVAAERIEEGK